MYENNGFGLFLILSIDSIARLILFVGVTFSFLERLAGFGGGHGVLLADGQRFATGFKDGTGCGLGFLTPLLTSSFALRSCNN